jgi:hypothetical protein
MGSTGLTFGDPCGLLCDTGHLEANWPTWAPWTLGLFPLVKSGSEDVYFPGLSGLENHDWTDVGLSSWRTLLVTMQ